MKLIALLRGINISGKNKIAMKELKTYFEDIGFINVVTILNSGNIIFQTTNTNDNKTLTEEETIPLLSTITKKINTMIKTKFNLDIPVLVITLKELTDIINHAPNWWGTNNKEIYDDLIFIFPEYTYKEITTDLGDIQSQIEQIQNYKNVIFWSFKLKDYQKSTWYKKSATSPVNTKITIRTAGTIKKILQK